MPGFPVQSNGSYTVIAFSVTPTTASQSSGYDIQLTPEGESGSGDLPAIPNGGQIDFQVEALVGQNSTYWQVDDSLPPQQPQGYYSPAIAYDSNSSWSNTQTVTIGQTSSVPELTPLAIVPLLLAVFSVAVAVRHRKTANFEH